MADGLLGEVSQLLAARLTIRAADEAHFGGKQVYGDVPLSVGGDHHHASTSHHDHGKKGKDRKHHDSHGHDHKNPVHGAIASARSIIDAALGGSAPPPSGDVSRVFDELASLRNENVEIKKEIATLKELISKLQGVSVSSAPAQTAAKAPGPSKEAAGDDDDFDLFGSGDEEEDEEKKRVVEERLKAYNEKKSKKPGPIAKSSIILDVKPWDDETDLGEMEKLVRSVEKDGLVWGGGKLIAIGYGIQKLQIICVVEDAKVSVDDVVEEIQAFEDYVQSVDIVAFNKI
ncbi:unnamed protein product, partial [Mesorhabditis belari]|uniref:Uncharacterized protein n=1 Tax=Mesorhabditis belari TaxID=2138241 RepID=A0AAF3ENS5_9BILA